MLSNLELRQRIVFAIETNNRVALRSLKKKLLAQYRRAAQPIEYVWLKRDV